MSTPAKSYRVDPNQIHLRNIVLLGSSLEADDNFLKSPSKPPSCEVKLGHSSDGNPNSNRFNIRLEIQLAGQDQQGQALGIKTRFLIHFEFEVDNLSDFILHRDEAHTTIGIEATLMLTLFNISYSTARGMVLSRTQGTFFDGVILPIIDPAALLSSAPPTF